MLAVLTGLLVLSMTAVCATAFAAPEYYAKTKGTWAKVTKTVQIQSESKNLEIVAPTWSPGLPEFRVKCTEWSSPGEVRSSTLAVISPFNVKCEGVVSHKEPKTKLCVNIIGVNANTEWTLEPYKEGTKTRMRYREAVAIFECETVFGERPRVLCSIETNALVTNDVLGGLVEDAFETKSPKTACEGKSETGIWTGTITLEPSGKEKMAGVEAIKVE
jgi:hypothetical protein